MEDFIEIIFYVVILVLSGIGSLMKNRKKQQKTVVPPRPSEVKLEPEIEAEVADQSQEEENELIRMLREAAAAAEAQKREKEMQEQQKRAAEEAELRRKEKAEREKKALLLRAEKERELAKMQATKKKVESVVVEPENTTLADLDLIDVDEARRAFVAAEIFNKKYC
jgi:DNA polymerase III gamma/tau subunit